MKITTITVRLPEDITSWLDSLVDSGLYKSRSEAIRDFSREFLAAEAMHDYPQAGPGTEKLSAKKLDAGKAGLASRTRG